MSDILEQARDYLKDVPPWGWGIAGAGALVLVIMSERKPEISPVPTVASVPDERQNFSNDKISESQLANKIENVKRQLSNNFEEKSEAQANAYEEKMEAQQKQFESQLTTYGQGWLEKVNALTSSYNERLSTLSNQLEGVSSFASDLREQQAQVIQQAKTYQAKAQALSQENKVHEVIDQMQANSRRWHDASPTERKQLHQENKRLSSSIDAEYDSASGEWVVDGKVINN